MSTRQFLPPIALLFLSLSGCQSDPEPAPMSVPDVLPAPAAESAPKTDPNAERAQVAEDINDSFLDPELDPEKMVARFERESREIAAQRDEIVTALDIQAGEDIADIGTGTGLFLEPFVAAVGEEGSVFAVDISPRLVEFVAQRARTQGWSQVEPVLCDEVSTKLPADSVDSAFICDTYHHFSDPPQTLASLFAALRPGGDLYVIDFERIPGESRQWTLDHVRAGKETFRSEIESAGFRFDREIEVEGLDENYMLRFVRP